MISNAHQCRKQILGDYSSLPGPSSLRVKSQLQDAQIISWESKVPPPKLPPPINKALLRDY